MVVDIFITVLPNMAANENSKVDHQALAKLAISRKAQGSIRHPTTKAERAMKMIWAQVPKVKPEVIRLNYSFFELGGNSIAGMKIVDEARKVGVRLAVGNIFRRDRLEVISELAGQQYFDASNPEEFAEALLIGAATKAAFSKKSTPQPCDRLRSCCTHLASYELPS